MNPDVQELKSWFEGSVKPFLDEHLSSKTEDLGAALARIEAHARRADEDLAICFLGDSGVGKSTLINALVAGNEMVLPSGGVGPLTALAMEVRYGAEPSLEAEYHGANKLWRGVIFGLERGYEAQLKEATGHGVDAAEPAEALGEDDKDEIESDAAEEGTRSRLDTFRKQAQLLVKGNQDAHAELPYLLDCLREAAGRPRPWGTALLAEDAPRLKRLGAALSMGKEGRTHQCSRIASPEAFANDLRDHASGFLAPLIKTLRVRWPSPLLQNGIVLVDLPGVGVSGDVYREVTRTWVSKRAKAVVLVVGRSGLTEATVDLLRTSNFLERLLFYRDARKEDPVVLAVAMSHLDSVAEDAWFLDKSRKKAVHLEEQFGRAQPMIQSQLRQMLARVWESGDRNVQEGQAEVIESLASTAMVFPVSAPEFRKSLVQDDDDRPFISTPEQSGVPQMMQGLVDTVQSRREEARLAREESIQAFISQVAAWAEMVRAQWTNGQRTEVEVQQFEADLQAMIAPLQKEFLVRQGGFRTFLKGTMPAHIGEVVAEAKESAHKEINRYLRSLKDAHWATLKAAVRREGTYYGARSINLPDDFARMFVEPVAQVWGTKIIQKIRKGTKEFAGDCERQVIAVAEWCRAEGARVSPKLLDAQIETIRADIKQVDLTGREIINELREQVKDELSAAIDKPIRDKCKKFVKDGEHVGPGVKNRILELFDALADDTTTAAAAAASDLLKRRFKEVEEELRQILKDLDDPLQSAADNILNAHRGRLERADERNRGRALESVEALMATPIMRARVSA